MRLGRAFVVALAGFGAAGVAVALLVPALAGLVLFALYSIPANSMIPVPHEPGLLFFARYYPPLAIAAAGTLGAALVCIADYAVVGAAMRHPRFRAAGETRLFRWAVRGMRRWPFAIVALFALVPMPVYVIRVLAPASGYPLGRYVVAQSVGRFPRFLALAWIGHEIQVPTWILVAIFAVLVAALLLVSPEASPG